MHPILDFPESLRPAELQPAHTVCWLHAEDWLMDVMGMTPGGASDAKSAGVADASGVVGASFLSPGRVAFARGVALLREALCRGMAPTVLAAEDIRWARAAGVAVLGPLARPLSLPACCASRLADDFLFSGAEARLWRFVTTGSANPGPACEDHPASEDAVPADAGDRLARLIRQRVRLPARLSVRRVPHV